MGGGGKPRPALQRTQAMHAQKLFRVEYIGQTHYTPTKAAIKSLMESCAIALGPMNIRCNSILPGQQNT